MQVEHDHRVPLGEHLDGGARLGLRLGDEITVDVEAVGVAAGAEHAAIGVLHDVEEQDHVLQDLLNFGAVS